MKHNNCQSDHIIYQTKGRSKSYCPHATRITDKKFQELSLFFSSGVRNPLKNQVINV